MLSGGRTVSVSSVYPLFLSYYVFLIYSSFTALRVSCLPTLFVLISIFVSLCRFPSLFFFLVYFYILCFLSIPSAFCVVWFNNYDGEWYSYSLWIVASSLGAVKRELSIFQYNFCKGVDILLSTASSASSYTFLFLLMVFFVEVKGSVRFQTSWLTAAVPGEW